MKYTVKNFRILTDIFSKNDTELVRTLQFRLLTERQSTCIHKNHIILTRKIVKSDLCETLHSTVL